MKDVKLVYFYSAELSNSFKFHFALSEARAISFGF